MLAQTDHSTVIFGIITIVFMLNSGAVGIMFKLRANDKKELEDHKKSVQYKDTCAEVVKRIDEKAEIRHSSVMDAIKNVEGLIKNNGNSTPRVQT